MKITNTPSPSTRLDLGESFRAPESAHSRQGLPQGIIERVKTRFQLDQIGQFFKLSTLGDASGYGLRLALVSLGIRSDLVLQAARIVGDEVGTLTLTKEFRQSDGEKAAAYTLLDGLVAQTASVATLHGLAGFGLKLGKVRLLAVQGIVMGLAGLAGEQIARLAGSKMPTEDITGTSVFLRLVDGMALAVMGRAFSQARLTLDRPLLKVEENIKARDDLKLTVDVDDIPTPKLFSALPKPEPLPPDMVAAQLLKLRGLPPGGASQQAQLAVPFTPHSRLETSRPINEKRAQESQDKEDKEIPMTRDRRQLSYENGVLEMAQAIDRLKVEEIIDYLKNHPHLEIIALENSGQVFFPNHWTRSIIKQGFLRVSADILRNNKLPANESISTRIRLKRDTKALNYNWAVLELIGQGNGRYQMAIRVSLNKTVDAEPPTVITPSENSTTVKAVRAVVRGILKKLPKPQASKAVALPAPKPKEKPKAQVKTQPRQPRIPPTPLKKFVASSEQNFRVPELGVVRYPNETPSLRWALHYLFPRLPATCQCLVIHDENKTKASDLAAMVDELGWPDSLVEIQVITPIKGSLGSPTYQVHNYFRNPEKHETTSDTYTSRNPEAPDYPDDHVFEFTLKPAKDSVGHRKDPDPTVDYPTKPLKKRVYKPAPKSSPLQELRKKILASDNDWAKQLLADLDQRFDGQLNSNHVLGSNGTIMRGKAIYQLLGGHAVPYLRTLKVLAETTDRPLEEIFAFMHQTSFRGLPTVASFMEPLGLTGLHFYIVPTKETDSFSHFAAHAQTSLGLVYWAGARLAAPHSSSLTERAATYQSHTELVKALEMDIADGRPTSVKRHVEPVNWKTLKKLFDRKPGRILQKHGITWPEVQRRARATYKHLREG